MSQNSLAQFGVSLSTCAQEFESYDMSGEYNRYSATATCHATQKSSLKQEETIPKSALPVDFHVRIMEVIADRRVVILVIVIIIVAIN